MSFKVEGPPAWAYISFRNEIEQYLSRASQWITDLYSYSSHLVEQAEQYLSSYSDVTDAQQELAEICRPQPGQSQKECSDLLMLIEEKRALQVARAEKNRSAIDQVLNQSQVSIYQSYQPGESEPLFVVRRVKEIKARDPVDFILLARGANGADAPEGLFAEVEAEARNRRLRQEGKNRKLPYGDTWGEPEVRKVVADYYKQIFKAPDLKASEIYLAVGGGKTAIHAVLEALGGPNSAMGVAGDHWPYEDYIRQTGSQYFYLKGDEFNNITPDTVREFAQDARFKGSSRRPTVLVLEQPGNPAGFYTKEQIVALAEECRNQGMILFLDAFYSRLNFDQTENPPFLASALKDSQGEDLWNVITVDGATKNHAAAGLRGSWLVIPDELANRYYHPQTGRFEKIFGESRSVKQQIELTLSKTHGGPPLFTQVAIKGMLKQDIQLSREGKNLLEPVLIELEQRVDHLIERAKKLGLIVNGKPKGGIYLYPRIPEAWRALHFWDYESKVERFLNTDADFQQFLFLYPRQGPRVALLKGSGLGADPSEGKIRLSYGGADIPTLDKAFDAMESALNDLRGGKLSKENMN